MNKADVVFNQAIKTNQDPTIILKPCKQSFNFPSSPIAAEFAPVLGPGFLSIGSMRGDQFHSIFSQLRIQWIAVIRFVADQTLRQLFGEHSFQSRLYEGDLMRRSTASGYGDRKTRAVCHCHDLCTFAPLGFSHPLAPFFAMTKVPSMKHSVKSRSPRSFMSFTNILRITSNVPERTHSWKRRWQVWYGGYRSGKSFHGAPVRMIHKIPLRISRLSRRGLPRPSGRFGGCGMRGLITSHCSSVRSIGSSPDRV